jgi:Uma2 family endonuclease
MSVAIPETECVGPTHLDLPHTDDKPAESTYQPFQSMLLTSCLTPVLEQLHPDGDFFIGADTGIYWRMTKPPERGCRAPDWFYVGSVPRLLDGVLRKSYVMWQESVSPPLVIEYVSGDGSEERDAAPYEGKFWVYERAIKAPYYLIWYSNEERIEAFELRGTKYRPMTADAAGRFRIPPLEVDFGIWDGEYLGYPGPWLRTWDRRGDLLLTGDEAHANLKQRADTLAAKLRELGIDPDRI